ncbi:MAG: sulfurtransferase [Gammaproteobacteria bacterium]
MNDDTEKLPLILEPDALQKRLGRDQLLIVDLCKPETYRQLHVPGALHLDYGRLVRIEKPVMGLLPDDDHLSRLFSDLGIAPGTHVVAYDDEGGGRAARLLWTLDVAGHDGFSLLNGGLQAWANEGYPLEHRPLEATPGNCRAHRTDTGITDKDYILAHLQDPDVVLLDTRSPEEYSGAKRLAHRAGHIPGAVNMDWVNTMDRRRNLRLLPEPRLREMLTDLNVAPSKQVIVYCHSHHRSAHTYIVLKALGYPRVKGYPGAWSEWGNDATTPVE